MNQPLNVCRITTKQLIPQPSEILSPFKPKIIGWMWEWASEALLKKKRTKKILGVHLLKKTKSCCLAQTTMRTTIVNRSLIGQRDVIG